MRRHVSTAGVMVSCEIPILATRVRFPGGAVYFCSFFDLVVCANFINNIATGKASLVNNKNKKHLSI